MKAILYARVSTEDQDPLMQKNAMIKRAELEGWDWEYVEEKESTRKTRPIKDVVYKRALAKECDVVCVWKVDRWARSSQELSREIETLWNKGVKFVSVTEVIDLTTDQGWLIFQIISVFAEFERRMISTRTKEGMKNAVNVGKRGKDKKRRKKSGYYLRWSK